MGKNSFNSISGEIMKTWTKCWKLENSKKTLAQHTSNIHQISYCIRAEAKKNRIEKKIRYNKMYNLFHK